MSSASEGQFLVKESVSFPGDYVLFVRYVGHMFCHLCLTHSLLEILPKNAF